MQTTSAFYVTGLALLLGATGCELTSSDELKNGTNNNGQSTASATQPAATATPVGPGMDALDISNARSLGTHAGVRPQSAAITRTLNSANVSGALVFLDYATPLGWSTEGKLSGRVYIFWQQGTEVLGGHFDWLGINQKAKTLENVHQGYLSGMHPPSGATVWFCLVSLDAKERTQVVKSGSTW